MRRFVALLLFFSALVSTAPSQVLTTVATFNGNNGIYPAGTLVQGSDGNFYGVTSAGGDHGYGTVFKVTPQGELNRLYSFCTQFDCGDGGRPVSGLLQAIDGNFYGTTVFNTAFQITPQGVLTTLHHFDFQEGDELYAGLVEDYNGDFYGATYFGGAWGDGTIFKITPAGGLTRLHDFSMSDGAYPRASLIRARDGNFYGTTSNGGDHGRGTIFKLTRQGTLTILHSFDVWEGSDPAAPLIQAKDGNFYSTTLSGGANNLGTVFKVTPEGTLTTIYSFCALQYCADGESPAGGLIQGSDGNLYGTTPTGFIHNGTVFKITPAGTLTVLHTFHGDDGSYPVSGLVQAADGSFYGTTEYGGANEEGTVFRLIVYPALSVAKSGMGNVSSADGHIYCGSACSYWYFDGSRIMLSAVPAPGYAFSGWTGCNDANGSYCSVTMAGAKNVTATFGAANVTLTSLTFKPSYVRGGQLSAGTLTLSGPAPPGGVTVALSSDHPGVAHPPPFVLVPGGRNSVGFAVNTFPVKSNITATITATAGSSKVSGTLTVGTTSLPQSIK